MLLPVWLQSVFLRLAKGESGMLEAKAKIPLNVLVIRDLRTCVLWSGVVVV